MALYSISTTSTLLDTLAELSVSVDAPGGSRTPRSSRQGQHRLTKPEITELVEAYQRGSSVPQLVTRFGIHKTIVVAHLRRAGVATRPHARKLTDEDVLEAAQRYRAGDSLTTIGTQFRVDAETVRRELKKAGVEMRPRPGAR